MWSPLCPSSATRTNPSSSVAFLEKEFSTIVYLSSFSALSKVWSIQILLQLHPLSSLDSSSYLVSFPLQWELFLALWLPWCSSTGGSLTTALSWKCLSPSLWPCSATTAPAPCTSLDVKWVELSLSWSAEFSTDITPGTTYPNRENLLLPWPPPSSEPWWKPLSTLTSVSDFTLWSLRGGVGTSSWLSSLSSHNEIVIGRILCVICTFYLFSCCCRKKTIKFNELCFVTYGGMIRGAIAFALVLKIPITESCGTKKNGKELHGCYT